MKLLVSILLLTMSITAQKKDPDAVLREVINKFNQVQDYSVNVKIKLDMPFIKAPDTDAKIYFKQPDKIHFSSEKFALVPKEGLDFSPMGLLKRAYTALYVRDENFNGEPHSVIKIIPLEDRGDVILSTLWINENKKAISKVESSTKTNGTFIMELFYDGKLNFPLPSKMIFTFNLNNKPEDFTQQNQVEQKETKKKKDNLTGKVYITYSDYQVNKGIPDSMFQEVKKGN